MNRNFKKVNRDGLTCMRIFLLTMGLIAIFIFNPGLSSSAEKSWKFLPSSTLFGPLIADPRESKTGFMHLPDQGRFIGVVGKSMDLFQWGLNRNDHFGWGITGGAFALLDFAGGSFPMRANDWQMGTYLSHSRNKFSQRLEFTHHSAHLGDQVIELENKKSILYTREFLRWVFAYDFNEFLRFYAGPGFLFRSTPEENLFFSQFGTELFFTPFEHFSGFLRFYAAYDLQIKEEAGGVINNSLQFGIQLKPFRKNTRRAFRIGITYFNGNNLFGQFYREEEEYWGIGFYFDI